MESNNSLITAPLSDGVILEGHILSTRTADAYKGVERATGRPVCIWKLRHPLSTGGDSINRFLSRMEALRGLGSNLCPIKYFGVEVSGLAYCVLEGLDGRPCFDGKLDVTEAERRFLSCIKLVSAIHKSSLVCGDICSASFWSSRNSDIIFVGVMGSFDTEAVSTAMMPPIETLHYVAPEQRMGGGIEPASDVFSLGVLGFLLFTGKSPFGNMPGAMVSLDKIPPINSITPNAPQWMNEIILKCLEPSANLRIQNASSLLQTIAERRKAMSEQLPAKSHGEIGSTRQAGSPGTDRRSTSSVYKMGGPRAALPDAAGNTQRSLVAKLIMPATVLAFIAIPVVYYFTQYRPNNPTTSTPSGTPGSTEPMPNLGGQIQESVQVVQSSSAPIAEKKRQLAALEASEDPLSHSSLVTLAVRASDEELKSAAETSLLSRVRRLGLVRTSDHLRQWLRFRVAGETLASYETVLKAVDPSLPLDARAGLLRQAYPGNERVILRLAAAYAFDSGKIDELQPLLSQLVGDAQRLTDANQHSSLALIAVSPELSVAFTEDLSQSVKAMSGEDLLWLMSLLAERDDPLLRAVAKEVVQKNILNAQRRVFLDVLQEKKELPADIVSALIRASSGALKQEDVTSLGNWFDTEAERVLVALCAEEYEPKMMLEIFDILAGKSVTIEPGAAFIKWIRDNDWNNRANYIATLGLMGTRGDAPKERIDKILVPFRPHIKRGSLMKLFMESKSEPLVAGLLRNYGRELNLATLLSMLNFPNAEIKIGALDVIKDYNDVTVFKLIIDHYEKEKDPVVRKAYQEKFWVIREREKGPAGR